MKFWVEYVCLLAFAPLGCAVASVTVTYEAAPFSHYQTILDRMPFGAAPSSVNEGPSAEDLEQQKTAEQEKAEQQQIAKQLSFSALNITPKGTVAVGFTDRTVNPPRSFYLEVGSSRDGWTVVSADYEKDWAQFEKDGVTITMHLDKGLIDGPPSATNDVSVVASKAELAPEPTVGGAASPVAPGLAPIPGKAVATTSVRSARTIPGLVRRPAPTGGSDVAANPDGAPGTELSPGVSFLERRRERIAQEQAKEEETRKAAEKVNLANMEKLAKKIAQDELAKRELEQSETFERLREEQALFQAQQREQEEREAAEAAEAEQRENEPDPDAENE